VTEPKIRAALILRKPEDAEKICKSKLFARLLPSEVRLLSFTKGSIGLPLHDKEVGSFFHVAERRLFDIVVLARQVPMFDAPCSWALLGRANDLVRPGGQLVFAHSDGNANPASLSLEKFISRLGIEPAPLKLPYVIARIENHQIPAASVVGWYIANHLRMLVDDVDVSASTMSEILQRISDSFAAELLIANDETSSRDHLAVALNRKTDFEPYRHIGTDFSRRISEAVGAHSYLITGLLHKAPIMAYVMRTFFRGRRDLVYLDAGGAFGALAAELLIDESSGIARALVRDIASQNLALIRNLYVGLYSQLRGRLQFSLGPIETFPFNAGYDVVSFIGSLLYVRKDALEETLQRAWAGLNEGGALVVHENIRNPSYVIDFDKMFSAQDLDTLLSTFGSVEYVSGQTMQRITRSQAGDLAVFRVVRKV
jgi:SAM-dependent methyltransferase